MKQGWKMITLGDACEKGSSNVSQNQLENEIGEYPIFGASGFIKNVSFYHNDNPYLSIVKDGSGVGRVTKMDANTSVIGTLQYIYPKESIDLNYLYYSLTSIDFKKYVAGAAIPHIYFKDYKNEPFLWMPLPEQKRIVAILDEAFTAIAKAKANAEQNLKNAKELFESYLQGVFEKKGDGWEEKRIDEICKLINGRAYKKDELQNNGKYRVLRVGNFFTSDHWYYSDLELDEDKYCDKEDLLYAWSASFGPRIWKEEKVIYHYHIWKVIPDEKLVTRDFLFTLFEWDKEKIKAAQGTGTTMIHVSKGSMESRIVPLPPLKEQQKIIRRLDTLRAEMQKLEALYQKKIADLEELKKSILQKAFAGELKTQKAFTV